MSLRWETNFSGSECRIFRGKLISGLLKMNIWKDEGRGELDGHLLKFQTKGFWKPKTHLRDIEGLQELGKIEYNYYKGTASITYQSEEFLFRYDSWQRRGWSITRQDESAHFKSISFWKNKGEIENEDIPAAVILSALYIHFRYSRLSAAA
jgi:hypothetical protein